MSEKHTIRYTWKVTVDVLRTFTGLFKFYRLKLTNVHDEGGEGVKTFVMQPKRPIKYTAGQYGVWFLPKFIWGKPARLFTIAASPTEGVLKITTHISDSPFKKKLDSLKVGSSIYLSGPFGVFTLGKNPPKKAVFVAGGIGITPMRAMMKYAKDTNIDTDMTLIHVAKNLYLFRGELSKIAHESHYITRDDLAETVRRVVAKQGKNVPFYISGPPAFVETAIGELKNLGATTIKTDGFLGY
jgi:ferredoxin-NADP reductase